MISGFPEDAVVSLDVDGYTVLYKLLKRLQGRQMINDSISVRSAYHGDTKQFSNHLTSTLTWFHPVEKATILAGLGKTTGTMEDFLRDNAKYRK